MRPGSGHDSRDDRSRGIQRRVELAPSSPERPRGTVMPVGPSVPASGVTVVNETVKIDRTETCPCLVRVFPTVDRHREGALYNRELPRTEIAIHTWLDATLRELVDLLAQANPDATRGLVSFERVTVHNKTGRYACFPLGRVNTFRRGWDDDKTLKELGFEIGDFLDVCVMSGGGGGGGRGRFYGH